ncbi:MAG: DUF1289 domain-containing protein [Planctomycetaceae bacterium]|nr:DUF1289 domain-containing protein [Planctomycetaceae bacterium]
MSPASIDNPGHSAESPCIGTCRLNAAKAWCTGCFRTVQEITLWRSLTDAQRQLVNASCALRNQKFNGSTDAATPVVGASSNNSCVTVKEPR